jgi:hypothetical protein
MNDLLGALADVDKQTRRMVRSDLRGVAEPTRHEAEDLARSEISHIGSRWPKMRIGVTKNLVYVAPRQRGVKGRGPDPRRRPNLARLLMDRAMEPALHRHEADIVANLDHQLEVICDRFNHDPSGVPL